MATGKVNVSRRGNDCSNSSKGRRDRPRYESRALNRQRSPQGHPENKKRKFSPIVWDHKDEPAKKSPRYGGEERKLFPERRVIQASIISAIVHSQSASQIQVAATPNHGQEGDGEQSVAEDGELVLVEERNISMSRWASAGYSPADASLSDEDDSGTTTESGEFRAGRPDNRSGSSGEYDSSSRASCAGQEFGNLTGVEECQAADAEVDDYPNQPELLSDEESSESEKLLSSDQGGVIMLNSCRSVFEYERLNKISEGTYGVVFRAKDKKTGEVVALKKVKMNDPDGGFPLTSLREINILLSINHPSIVTVKEVVMSELDDVFMVMEYMEHDLKELMEMRKRPFSTSEIKCLMLQLLDGVKYLHDNWVLHRDLKTSNLLMNNKGELKICDLGMSRQYGSPLKPYTSLVVTMWYRAPELLLGAEEYSTAIDMWSIGCIMGELLANEPLFNGKNEVNQLDKIFRTLGTPNEKIWPKFSKLPGAKANFVKQPFNTLRKKFPAASFTGCSVLSESGFDLLNRLLTYDPEKRITADEALNHAWFREVPLATSKELMPTFPPRHLAGR